jgi:hypothetical protein
MGTITFLPLDLTAAALKNRIIDESHTLIKLQNRNDRLVLPVHGGFYSEHTTLVDANGVTLVKGVDWKPTYLYRELTELTGREVYGMVVVTNPNVSATVKLSYRAVGGPFNVSVRELKDVLDALQLNQLAVNWDDVVAKPTEYNPEDHLHKYWQLYGFESTNYQLARIGTAWATGSSSVLAYEEEYGTILFDECQARLDLFVSQAEAHYQDFDNPHRVTKAQVEMADMENWPMASTVEAVDPTVANRYTSPGSVYEALTVTALPSLTLHLQDYNNPHGVTLNQLSAYSYNESMTLLEGRLAIDGMAVNSNLLQGRTYATLYSEIRSNIPAGNVTGGVFAPARLGSGTANAGTALLGNKMYRDLTSIFDEYAQTGNLTLYVGYRGSAADVVGYLAATYADTTAYPVGTVALARVLHSSNRVGTGNGGAAYTDFYQVQVFQRTSSGWVSR